MAQTAKLLFLAVMVTSTTAKGLLDFGSKIVKATDSNPFDASLGIAKISVKAFTDTAPAVASIGVVNAAGKAAKTNIAIVKQPISQTVTLIGSSQCSNLKKLAGVHYEQVEGVAEPDLNQLTLNFISDELRSSFKLGTLASSLPVTPGFNRRQPLIIFMHGFIDNPTLFNFAAVNEAFQDRGHCNILALDASPLIHSLYLRSSTYVRFIGEKLGETLAGMVRAGLDPRDIHLVGHSLGSHISGFAGKTFLALTGALVGRITGLDPAGPCFSHVDESLRLLATDAEFVDVIHSNGGVYGLKEPIGHVDYFPNGGELQPNCLFEFCAHNRVVELFAESVRNPNAFPAVACRDWHDFQQGRCSEDISLMGYGSLPGTRGLYYLRTRDETPFGLGLAGLRKKYEEVKNTIHGIKDQLADSILNRRF